MCNKVALVVLVKVWQCLCITFCLSVSFSLLSFIDTGKPNDSQASDLKLTGKSTISQNLVLGSYLPLVASATFALLPDLRGRGTQRMTDMHGLKIVNVDLKLTKTTIFTWKTYQLILLYMHNDIKTLYCHTAKFLPPHNISI